MAYGMACKSKYCKDERLLRLNCSILRVIKFLLDIHGCTTGRMTDANDTSTLGILGVTEVYHGPTPVGDTCSIPSEHEKISRLEQLSTHQ